MQLLAIGKLAALPWHSVYAHAHLYIMQDVDFSSAIQSAWLGWEHGRKLKSYT